MKKFYVLSLGIGALLLATHYAHASPACLPHTEIVDRLAAKYGERRQSIGIGNGNTVVETFASDITGTWSITVTAAGGLTCLVAAGRAYQVIEVVDEGT